MLEEDDYGVARGREAVVKCTQLLLSLDGVVAIQAEDPDAPHDRRFTGHDLEVTLDPDVWSGVTSVYVEVKASSGKISRFFKKVGDMIGLPIAPTTEAEIKVWLVQNRQVYVAMDQSEHYVLSEFTRQVRDMR